MCRNSANKLLTSIVHRVQLILKSTINEAEQVCIKITQVVSDIRFGKIDPYARPKKPQRGDMYIAHR